MKKSEIIKTEDHATFAALMQQHNLSEADRILCIKARWNYLYDKYRPSGSHVEARKRYNKSQEGR